MSRRRLDAMRAAGWASAGISAVATAACLHLGDLGWAFANWMMLGVTLKLLSLPRPGVGPAGGDGA